MLPEEAAALFDASAARYDRVNTLISLGLDAKWRRWVARAAVAIPGERVLDAFAGTGATGLACGRRGGVVTLADTSAGMLEVAERRIARDGAPVRAVRVDLTADELPFAPGTFDALTCVFGVRYLEEPARTLSNLATLVGRGGRVIVMEFVEPRPTGIQRLAAAYYFGLLPKIASAAAGSSALYEYLTTSTRRLGPPSNLDALVRDAGLRIARTRTMGFGLVHGIIALR